MRNHFFVMTFFLLGISAAFADSIELLDGTILEGLITSRDDSQVIVDVLVNGQIATQVIPKARIYVIIQGETREIITPREVGESAGKRTWSRNDTAQTQSRSREDVEQIIDYTGTVFPDWWDQAQLNIPSSLDLSFTLPPKDAAWNNQKYVGQFVWDVVNPDPKRWRASGIRLYFYLADKHRDDAEKSRRAMSELGAAFFRFERDYARAAYWWRKAGVDQRNSSFAHFRVDLAECYWQLGCKSYALELLTRVENPSHKVVKLYVAMEETEKAAAEVRRLEKNNAPMANLYAGLAARFVGDWKRAAGFYEKAIVAIENSQSSDKKRDQRLRDRAEANLAAIKLMNSFKPNKIRDGVYEAESIGYEGPVKVQVKIVDQKIDEVQVLSHREKQYYKSITETCRQIESRGLKGVDGISGATITSEAILNAATKAVVESTK